MKHDIIEAIKLKYEMLGQIKEEKKEFEEKNKILNISKSKITKYSLVSDGINCYLSERKKDTAREFIHVSTYDNDLFDFQKNKYLLDYGIFDVSIVNVDKDYAQSFVDYLWDRPATKGKNKGNRLSENTIYKPYSFIHKIFNYFKDDLNIIEDNPFDFVKRKPHAVAEDKEYFTDEEMHYIKEKLEFKNIRFKTLITFMMDMGCRREEALAIKWKDINWFRKTVSIERAFVKSRMDHKYIIKPVKRKKSEREIICTSYVLELLTNYKKFKEACGFVVTDDDFVFTAWDSMDIVDPDRYTREFKKFINEIGIKKDIPLKNLRTTNASFFVARGENLKAIQNRVGHENIETTLTFYAQSNYNDDKKLVQMYEEEFYNKLGLSMADLYRIVANRFSNQKKLINVLEKVGDEVVDYSNYDIQLERCQEYFKELFPVFNKILKIDSLLDDDEIDHIFEGFQSLYHTIKIGTLSHNIKI